MTTIHNASLDAGASSAELTVAALEPHGLMADVECVIYCMNGATAHAVAHSKPGYTRVFYPTTATLKITNISDTAGVVMVTAK